ncbi:MAG: NCS2 family permease [Deltaproteobacteria bacterium]|nr:NCS2 family permease [Deltaproteobacteria bacterium]
MFNLKENNTTASIEIFAGLTTFLSLVYVLSVNPIILSAAGMPKDALFTATALGAAVATLIMCLVAGLPFAVAPGMGLNAFFSFSVVLGMGFSWRQAATAVLLAGLAFVLLSLSPFRKRILNEVPESLQLAVAAGIGLMIAYIGLKGGALVTVDAQGNALMGAVGSGPGLLTLIGLFVTAAFLALKMRHAILIGIVLTTIVGIPLGVTDVSGLTLSSIVSLPPSVSPLAFKFDFSVLGNIDFLAVVFTFLFMCVFDSLAGFIGLFAVMGSEAERYRPRISRAFIADSLGVVAGAAVGLSPNTAYAESGAGVAAGGRTGLTSLTVAALLFSCLFVSKLFLLVPAPAVAPALVLVGLLMLESVKSLNFADKTESFPAFVVIIVTCLTWRLSDSLAAGWLLYILMKVIDGKARLITPTVWIVGALFLFKEIMTA